MSQQIINISNPDDGLGDALRNGFDKSNQNFTELYNSKVDKVTGKGLSENDFTNSDKAKLNGIEAGAQVNVQADWGETDPVSDSFIQNKPPSLYSAFGYFHYADLDTQTTPLNFLASSPLQLINDTLGAFTNENHAPYAISSVWDKPNDSLDFSQLSVGDSVLFRADLSISTTSVNQNLQLYIKFGIGTPSEYDLLIDSWNEKSVVSFKHFIKDVSFSIDNVDWRDAPAKIFLLSDDDGSVKVNGWYIPIIRKSVNIVNFTGGNDFKKKIENTRYKSTLSGENVIIPFQAAGQSHYSVTNAALVSVAGFTTAGLTTPMYEGQDVIFENQTGHEITLKGSFGVDTSFVIGADLIVPNNGKLWFRFRNNELELIMKSWVDIDVSSKLDKSTTPSSVYGTDASGGQTMIPVSEFKDVLEFANSGAFPITGENGKIYLALDTNLQYRWGGSAYVQIGGGKQSYFVDWEGYIQFTQNPTGWYNRALGPQNVYWTSQFATSIGTNPQGFDARTNCKVLPFDCKLINANVRINQKNNTRTIRIKGYKFNSTASSGMPINVVEIFDLTKNITESAVSLVQGVDFTINSTNLSKGDLFLFVVNQVEDLASTALNVSMNFEFEKI